MYLVVNLDKSNLSEVLVLLGIGCDPVILLLSERR